MQVSLTFLSLQIEAVVHDLILLFTATHKLTKIKEAYDLALMASRKVIITLLHPTFVVWKLTFSCLQSDPFLAERKTIIINDLNNLNTKLQRINENYKDGEVQIRKRMEDALKKLQTCADEKVPYTHIGSQFTIFILMIIWVLGRLLLSCQSKLICAGSLFASIGLKISCPFSRGSLAQ